MFEDVEEIRPDGEQPLHFYYNHEERIAKAPQSVKDYYNGKMKPVRGFKVLFNKQNKFIFFALIIIVAFGWGVTGLSKKASVATIKDLNCELTAFSYDETVFVSVKMKRSSKSSNKAPEMVNAEIRVIDPNKQVSDKKQLSFIYNEGEQFLREKFTDYDIISVEVAMNVDGQEKLLTSEVKR